MEYCYHHSVKGAHINNLKTEGIIWLIIFRGFHYGRKIQMRTSHHGGG